MERRSTFLDGGSKRSDLTYGRRARYDCCTDCGSLVEELGDLWCPAHRTTHASTRELAAEAGHRTRILEYARKGGLG
jgi:hypothetical protein